MDATTRRELDELRAEVARPRKRGERRRWRGGGRWLGVALVALLALLPAALGASDRFDDVPDGVFYHDDASAIADVGITLGCGGGNYCPDQVVTRGQMASFLARTAGLGDHEPVVNAATAQTVPDKSVTAEKISADGSSVGQVLVSDGSAVTWQAPSASTPVATGTVAGYLSQQSTISPFSPAAGVTVYLSGTTVRTTTDATGRFVLANVPIGVWTITMTYLRPPDEFTPWARRCVDFIPDVQVTTANQVVELPGYFWTSGLSCVPA